ncbi:MAG: hypothetical protein FJX72_13090 [Armatimonadetes bacterium]|nr:hypothetical protein [Armatimonadota bacterium]
MRTAHEVKRLILAAAIASAMAICLSALPRDLTTVPRASVSAAGSVVHVADKGSDGQETHG